MCSLPSCMAPRQGANVNLILNLIFKGGYTKSQVALSVGAGGRRRGGGGGAGGRGVDGGVWVCDWFSWVCDWFRWLAIFCLGLSLVVDFVGVYKNSNKTSMRPQATSIWCLQLLGYEALSWISSVFRKSRKCLKSRHWNSAFGIYMKRSNMKKSSAHIYVWKSMYRYGFGHC